MDLIDIENAKKKELNDEKQQRRTYQPRYDGRAKKRGWQNTTSEETDVTCKREREELFERIKRKKSAVLLGYCGKNYWGMQRNPGMKTIEEDLLSAMHKHKWISDEAFETPQEAAFQRAARTDKGVSAARQCVSMKLPNDTDIAALNSDLPDDIRVFAVHRVTKGFNSKDQCDFRTYSYTLPTIAFSEHSQLDSVDQKGFRVDPARLDRVNEVLQLFEGTKKFHNFTAKKGFHDPSSKRFMVSFKCGPPFVRRDVEFATIQVKGQSFMLHQIRKMVGLVLAIVRGIAADTVVEQACSDILMDIPTAPGLGLMLDQVHYDRYNKRYGSDGMHEALEWTGLEEEIQCFVNEKILPTILDTEIEEQPMFEWLQNLSRHSYQERTVSSDDTTVNSNNGIQNEEVN